MSQIVRTVLPTLAVLWITGATVPANATYPGANGEIAYARYGGPSIPSTLRTIKADGAAGRVLARPGIGSPDAEWSPDGTQVAMVLGREPSRIVMLDLQTDERTLVIRSDDVPDTRLIDSIGISPTGDQLVFCAVPQGAGASLFTVGVDGMGLTEISGDRQECFPDWGPSDRIAAERFGKGSKLVTMDPDGGNRVVVVRSRDANRGSLSYPSWSPDGMRLVFSSTSEFDVRPELWIVDADGSDLTQLTNTDLRTEWAPVFSPDGARIAFLRAKAGEGYPVSDIFTMAVDGSDRQQVTHTPNRREFPRSWQAI